MQKKNARLPEGKTSALDSANGNTGPAHVVRCLDAEKNPSERLRMREISYAPIRSTAKADRSPMRFRNTAPHPTDTTDKSPRLSVMSVTPGALFEKLRLHGVNQSAYTFLVAETTAARGESRKCKGGHPPTGGFFSSAAMRTPSMVGPWRGCACARRSPLRRSLNPALCPATPFESGGRVIEPSKGGRTMRQALARPEQTQSPTELANSALRAAALAPTVFDALDICADAMLVLAALAQPLEVRHA